MYEKLSALVACEEEDRETVWGEDSPFTFFKKSSTVFVLPVQNVISIDNANFPKT